MDLELLIIKPRKILNMSKKMPKKQIDFKSISMHMPEKLYGMIIYIDKISYDHTICHIYETDPDLAKKAIQVLQKVDYWTAGHRENLVWTDIATGLNVITKYYKPYRYICEPSQSTPYTGCPYKKYCLENLSKQHNQTFTSLVRYDQYLKNKEN